MHPEAPQPVPLPDGAFLTGCAQRGAYTDCFALNMPGAIGLPALVEAVTTSPLFKLERWVLARLLRLPSTDAQARLVTLGQADRFAAWRVERRSDTQILMDAGQTRQLLAAAARRIGAVGLAQRAA